MDNEFSKSITALTKFITAWFWESTAIILICFCMLFFVLGITAFWVAFLVGFGISEFFAFRKVRELEVFVRDHGLAN